MAVEPELKEQVRQLYSQIDKKGLGDRAMEIALDLIYCQPELAIDLIHTSQETRDSGKNVDLAFANLSLRTILGRTHNPDSGEACAKMRAELQDPVLQKCVDTISALWGGCSASEVISMLDTWENHSAEFARSLVDEVQRLRSDFVLDNERASNTYIACCRLAIRAFSGLVKRQLYAKSDLEDLGNLIENIPCARAQAMLWTEVALRLYVDGAETACKEVSLNHVKVAIGQIPAEAKEERAEAIIGASAALFCGHSGNAEEMIDSLEQDGREGIGEDSRVGSEWSEGVYLDL